MNWSVLTEGDVIATSFWERHLDLALLFALLYFHCICPSWKEIDLLLAQEKVSFDQHW